MAREAGDEHRQVLHRYHPGDRVRSRGYGFINSPAVTDLSLTDLRLPGLFQAGIRFNDMRILYGAPLKFGSTSEHRLRAFRRAIAEEVVEFPPPLELVQLVAVGVELDTGDTSAGEPLEPIPVRVVTVYVALHRVCVRRDELTRTRAAHGPGYDTFGRNDLEIAVV